MLIDKYNTFAQNEDFSGSGTTTKLGDAIDLVAYPSDMGEGYPYYFVALITADMTAGTSIKVNLVTADDDALSTNAVVLMSSKVVAQADAVAGTKLLVAPLPKADYARYLGITVTRAGTSTAGDLTAFLTQDPPNWRAYPEANS